MQALVYPAVIHQLLVCAGFADGAAIENHNLVGASDGREAVRNHDYGTVRHQIRQCPLHQHFGFGVQMRGGFVQDQDGCIFEQCAGYGDALPLAPAELDPAFADNRVVALRQTLDELVRQRASAARRISSRAAAGRPYAMLLATVSLNRNVSWATIPILARRVAS